MTTLYKKRSGTSGISGQLYETKLISLLLFRLQHDDTVEEFYLASNMDDIGAFDDICIKIKIKGKEKPIILFIQVKHKDNDDKFVTFDNNNDLFKWSDSLLKIKQKFDSGKASDNIFNGKYWDNECVSILYTNAKYDVDLNHELKCGYATYIDNLLATRDTLGAHALCTEKNVRDFSIRILKEEMSVLAERLIKYLYDKANQSMNILNDDYILKYHVVLAKKVVKLSEIQCDKNNKDLKWRQLTFQSDFLSTNDKNLMLLRRYLYEKLFSYAKLKKFLTKDEIKIQDLSTPETVMKNLIWPYCELSTDKELERPRKIYRMQLGEKFLINKEKEYNAIKILSNLKLKVPVAFGNVDFTIRGNSKKIESRLSHLTNVMINLCQNSKLRGNFKIIIIDDTFDEGLLSPNGGLGGTVGNVLDYDEVTKLLKFSDNHTSLNNNAENLYLKLKSKIENLREYRFDVKTSRFPRLSFDYTDIARDFFNKFVVYAKQSNHYEIEEILKKEIDVHNSTKCHNLSVQTDSVFLYYHNQIQKWWMSPKTGTYLTKSCEIYQQSINNIIIEPQMSGLQNMFHINKLKNMAFAFTENAMESLQSILNTPRSVITTDISMLMTMKVVQYLRTNSINKYTVLGLELILNMADEDFIALNAELKKTDKVVIIVCDNLQNNRILHKRLDCILHATNEKHIIVVINNTFVELIDEYFPRADYNSINDKENISDLTSESQIDIIKNAHVIFQGHKLHLNLILDDESIEFINGSVLDKIIRNKTIVIGETLTNSNYEEIKHLYIERRVNLASDNIYNINKDFNYDVRTLYDLPDDIILLTAKPGMGKSTLLTHLSLKTKEIDSTVWIVRLNLLDHSKEFYNWQINRTLIDTLTTLKFLCQTIIKNYNLQIKLRETNEMVYLEDCEGDEWTKFELNLFLNLYNKRKVIFLFDGFDEICPHYKDYVVKFLNVIINFPQRNKMWVTSRPYSEILPDLKKFSGKCYEIGYFNDIEQELYVNKIWTAKLVFANLKDSQLNNTTTFIYFINKIFTRILYMDALNYKFFRIYCLFYKYIKSHFPHIITTSKSQFHMNSLASHLATDSTIEVNDKENQIIYQNSETDTLLGTPLLLYLVADYFVNLIRDKETPNEWKLCINTYTIYTMFIESKLKTILFQDKNKMDVYNPNIITKYEKERKDCLNAHKNMAAYVLLGSPIFNGLNLEELKEMDPLNEGGIAAFNVTINSIKSGIEKTGLISHVTADEVPVFIHRTFAEYFAAEFICDIFKSNKYTFDAKKMLYTTTSVCHLNDIFPWIAKKRETDDELHNILKEIENNLPFYTSGRFIWYRKLLAGGNWSLDQYIRLLNANITDFKSNTFDYQFDNDDYLYVLDIKETKESVVSKMKPHIKKYFDVPVKDHQMKYVQLTFKSKYFRFKKIMETVLRN